MIFIYVKTLIMFSAVFRAGPRTKHEALVGDPCRVERLLQWCYSFVIFLLITQIHKKCTVAHIPLLDGCGNDISKERFYYYKDQQRAFFESSSEICFLDCAFCKTA